MKIAVVIGALVLLVACTALAPEEERFLTKEQDQQYKEACGLHTEGCVVIPVPAWNKIEIILRTVRGWMETTK